MGPLHIYPNFRECICNGWEGWDRFGNNMGYYPLSKWVPSGFGTKIIGAPKGLELGLINFLLSRPVT